MWGYDLLWKRFPDQAVPFLNKCTHATREHTAAADTEEDKKEPERSLVWNPCMCPWQQQTQWDWTILVLFWWTVMIYLGKIVCVWGSQPAVNVPLVRLYSRGYKMYSKFSFSNLIRKKKTPFEAIKQKQTKSIRSWRWWSKDPERLINDDVWTSASCCGSGSLCLTPAASVCEPSAGMTTQKNSNALPDPSLRSGISAGLTDHKAWRYSCH